jgi:hypothetical protein
VIDLLHHDDQPPSRVELTQQAAEESDVSTNFSLSQLVPLTTNSSLFDILCEL